MSDCLKNAVDSGARAPGDFAEFGTITVIPDDASGPGQATYRNLADPTTGVGDWLISFGGRPCSLTQFDVRLQPGESFTEQDPPKGEVRALHTDPTDVNADDLEFYVSWRQC